MEQLYKEVHYHDYCNKCKHEKVKDTDDPCNECLENPINLYSSKPINFEEKDKNQKTK